MDDIPEPPRVVDDPLFTWSEVEQGFFVGSCRGNFMGYVDHAPSGSYLAYDMTSRLAGEFTDLDAAIAHLTDNFLPTAEAGVQP